MAMACVRCLHGGRYLPLCCQPVRLALPICCSSDQLYEGQRLQTLARDAQASGVAGGTEVASLPPEPCMRVRAIRPPSLHSVPFAHRRCSCMRAIRAAATHTGQSPICCLQGKPLSLTVHRSGPGGSTLSFQGAGSTAGLLVPDVPVCGVSWAAGGCTELVNGPDVSGALQAHCAAALLSAHQSCHMCVHASRSASTTAPRSLPPPSQGIIQVIDQVLLPVPVPAATAGVPAGSPASGSGGSSGAAAAAAAAG